MPTLRQFKTNYFFFILECLFSFKLTANTRRYNKGSNKPLCKICKLHVAFSLTILLTSSTECTYLFSKTFILSRPDLWHSFSVFIIRCIAIQVDWKTKVIIDSSQQLIDNFGLAIITSHLIEHYNLTCSCNIDLTRIQHFSHTKLVSKEPYIAHCTCYGRVYTCV